MKKSVNNIAMTSLLLRVGLVLVFVYAAVASLQHPLEWAGFLPSFLTKTISSDVLIKFFALYELALVVWLASGKYIRYCALLCTATLLGIVITNPSQLITTFRDVGLAFMSLSLYFVEK